MKINSLQIENVKRVKAVTLEPTPNGLTVIGGGHTVHMDWPDQKSLPGYGMTRARVDLDHALARSHPSSGCGWITGWWWSAGARTATCT